MSAPTSPPAAFRLLCELFTTRFYDNDLLGPDVDLRRSFIWLVAALMTPSVFLALKVLNKYGSLAVLLGPEGVAAHAVFEKTLLIGFAMVAMGMLTVLAWDALLVDRRDALILGTLPVAWRTILAAKGVTLVAFWIVTTVAVNIVSAIVFALTVGAYLGVLRQLVAHLASTFAASACVFSWLVLLQAAAVSAFGVRASRWLAVGMQLAFGALLLSVLLLLPGFADGVSRTVQTGTPPPWWWPFVPPIWFLAAYEQLAGRDWPALAGLAARAWWSAILGPIAAALVTVSGYRRHLRRQVSDVGGHAHRTGLAVVAVSRIARSGPARALATITLATLARSGHHRLMVGLSVGVSLALGLVGVLRLITYAPIEWEPPPIAVLSLPLVFLFVVSAAVRGLFTVPSDLPARWVFGAAEPADRGGALDGVRVVLWVVGLAAPAGLAVVAGAFLWRLDVALLHVLWCVALGAVLVEIWMGSVDRVPFTTGRAAGSARLQFVWPAYGAGFVAFAYTSVEFERGLLGRPTVLVLIAALLFLCAGLLRRRHHRRASPGPFAGEDDLPTSDLLGLSAHFVPLTPRRASEAASPAP